MKKKTNKTQRQLFNFANSINYKLIKMMFPKHIKKNLFNLKKNQFFQQNITISTELTMELNNSNNNGISKMKTKPTFKM